MEAPVQAEFFRQIRMHPMAFLRVPMMIFLWTMVLLAGAWIDGRRTPTLRFQLCLSAEVV